MCCPGGGEKGPMVWWGRAQDEGTEKDRGEIESPFPSHKLCSFHVARESHVSHLPSSIHVALFHPHP